MIITVTLHRRKPWSCALKNSKRAYGLTILRPLIRFYALSRYCDDKIRSILQNHPFVHRIQNYKKIFA